MKVDQRAFAIYVMGVSGSGKSTVGKALADKMELSFYDGDDFHPPANIDKMKAQQALNDDDRYDWLSAIHAFVKEKLELNQSIVIPCSALKEKYRLQLSEGIPRSQIHWVYLKGDYALILERIQAREGHFMPPALLQSQFDTLEAPENAIIVDINLSIDDMVKYVSMQIRGQINL